MMEETTLQFKENLLNIRRIIVTNNKKISKISFKRQIVEREKEQIKKLRMREKVLERPRLISRSVGGRNTNSAVKNSRKTGLMNALGLFVLITIASNFEKIKDLVTGFIKGETFKKIASFFIETINFFKNLYNGLTGNYGELLGEKYDQLVEVAKEKLSDLDKLTKFLADIADAFIQLGKQALALKEKYLNMLGVATNKTKTENTDGNDKPYNGLYEKGDDGIYYNIFDGTPLPDELGDKENNSSDKIVNNMGLTDIDKLALNNNPLDFDNNELPFKLKSTNQREFDFSQYNDDKMNQNTTIITQTNTVIT